MFTRRRVLQNALATAGALSVASPMIARAQKPLAKVRYNEVVRSVLYAPAYVAIANGYFKKHGIDLTLSTANGGDKSVAALLSGSADIALIGPETAIYVQISNSPTKIPIFCGLTATDGFMLVGRKKPEKFQWSDLKGKNVLGFRPGSTPLLFLEAAMRKNGVDPEKDVKLMNNVAVPARYGSWLAGQNEYAIFIEPDASRLQLDGKGYILASIGATVGPADYTTFMATDKYIHDHPDIIQNWTDAVYEGMKWTASAPSADVAKILQQFFPGVNPKAMVDSVERYRKLKIWKTTPVIDPEAIARFEDILVQGHVLDPNKRVKYQDLVLTKFAKNAK